MFKFWPFWTLTISFHSRYPEIWRIILQCSYERQRSGSICQSLHSIFPEFWCLHRDTKLNFDLGSAFGNCNIQTEHGINMTEWVMGRIWCVKHVSWNWTIKKIWMAAENIKEQLYSKSPFLEIFYKQGVEFLYFTKQTWNVSAKKF